MMLTLALLLDIPWVEGLEAAKNQGKPVLLFQLLGRYDDRFC